MTVAALLLGFATVVAQPEPSAAMAAPPGPLQTNAVFNKPGGTQLVDYLAGLIKSTESGQEIQLAALRLWEPKINNALIDAAGRGVKVKIVADHGTEKPKGDDDPNGEGKDSYRDLKAAIGGDTGKSSWIHLCEEDNACIGDVKGKALMHSKFLLFSRTRGAAEVVVLPTANFSRGTEGGIKGWNSAYTDVGNADLYERFENYFKDLKAEKKDPNYYDHNDPEVTDNTKSYFHPREPQSGSDDTFANILGGVECGGSRKTRIRVSNWYIARTKVARKLWQLSFAGCDVEIVANQISPPACEVLVKPLPIILLPSPVKIYGFSRGKRSHGTHEKNMMIDGKYLDKNVKVTFTGSHNFTPSSLYENDENIIRIYGKKIHQRFDENFLEVKDAADRFVDTEHPAQGCADLAPEPKLRAANEVE